MQFFRNLKVGRKLVLTFGVILALFLASSAFYLVQINKVIDNLSYFYDHPYQVGNTAREVKAELLTARVAIKDALLTGSLDQSDVLMQKLGQTDEQVAANIHALRNRYLGPKSDIDEMEKQFHSWQVIRDQVLSLMKRGDLDGARSLSGGDATKAGEAMLNALDKIIAFANAKAQAFYSQAIDAHAAAERTCLLFLALALAASLLLAWLMTRNIAVPLGRLMAAIGRVRNGEEITAVETGSRRDEMGVVSESFNSMLAYLKTKKELEELAMTLEYQKSLEQYKVTLLSIGDAVISTDTEGHIANMNPVAETLTGWPLEMARGRPIDEVFRIINSKTLQPAENPLHKVLALGTIVGLANHTMLLSRSGQSYHIADSASPIRDAAGTLFGVVLVFRDVTEEYLRQEEILYISFHDKLTGLYNRAFFEEEARRLNSSRQMPLSIIMGDINGLKLINDTFGHLEGDRYLAAAADTLRRHCRSEDVVARWGGDEFVILLPHTSLEESQRIMTRITQAFAQVQGFPIHPSIAMGCAEQLEVEQDPLKALKEAETNMYRHKLLDSQSVRNAIVASLDNTMNERSYETEEHASAMASLCDSLSSALGLNERDRDELSLLAKLHDIGKIAINDAILGKPGELDEAEWITMKKHAEIGYRIAKALSELEHIAEGILSHHERWDGTGYPRGLAGEAIPLSARIIAVADAYDVMTRGRPYRLAISCEEAMDELRRCSGTQFDPQVVEKFLELVGAQEGEQVS